MVLKTFNLDEEVYKEFSKHCKKNGISMSKRIENFIREEVRRMKSGRAERIIVNKGIRVKAEHHSFSKYC